MKEKENKRKKNKNPARSFPKSVGSLPKNKEQHHRNWSSPNAGGVRLFVRYTVTAE